MRVARHLLDSNVALASSVPRHEAFDAAWAWFRRVDAVALCPISQGALVRYLIRDGESIAAVAEVLASLHDSERVTFWPDDLDYRDLDLSRVRGHRQVTDLYLVALASRHDARLVTFDRALAASTEHVDLIEVEATG